MARKVFFSFHYNKDVSRAHVVRNSWVTKEDREEAGFFDASVFESKQRTSDEILKGFLTEGLKGTSVTCVLIGEETALRPWVRYEIVRSFQRGNGLFGIKINGIRDFDKQLGIEGGSPFDCLAYKVVEDRVQWQHYTKSGWASYQEVPTMHLSDVAYPLNNELHHTFACRFRIYDWVMNDGYTNLATWAETAAKQAGK
jgi:hypothetical protein